MDLQKIGTCLRGLRKEKGLTQEQLAEHFGVSGKTVSRWENGVHMPDLELLLELSDFYEVDLRALLKGERTDSSMTPETKETVQEAVKYSENKHRGRTKRRIVTLTVIFVVIIVGILLLFQNCFIEEMVYDVEDKAYPFQGKHYYPAEQYEAIETTGGPVGQLGGYKLYTLANDPNRLFLYPRSLLLENRYLLARTDVHLPDPAEDAIDYIEIDNRIVDQEAEALLIRAFQGDYKSVYTGDYFQFDKRYSVKVYFLVYPQVYYQTSLNRFESGYGLYLYNEDKVVLLDETTVNALGLD